MLEIGARRGLHILISQVKKIEGKILQMLLVYGNSPRQNLETINADLNLNYLPTQIRQNTFKSTSTWFLEAGWLHQS